MKTIKFLMVACLCIISFSCAAKQEKSSYVDIEGNPDIIKKLAIEIVDLIHQEKNIANTVIHLVYDGENAIADEVLTELKKRGFGLSDVDGITTAFTVESYGENRIYLCVTLDKTMFSRFFLFEAQTGKISPASPLCKGEL